ncbi:DEAD-domain-containing protein [Jaminaea rosea]|uniref:RNA helicase n=1 Tax=Jaminaea rosea TaxID=1569628 RepID=A0A316UXS2_9BASI|nr:DEAD-domain-containing protein [Jaminaea rosea]PWN30012.1 DEAD-domain-containing protein [Jaminaea rosea]
MQLPRGESDDEEDNEEDEVGQDGELEFSGFADEDDIDVQSEEEDADEFGGGIVPAGGDADSEEDKDDDEDPLGSSDDDEDDEDEDGEDDVSDQDDDVESASEADSDHETEVEKARKAAFFASEETANGKTSSSATKDAATAQDALSSFQSFSLSRPLLRGLAALSFSTPTPIQSRTIPIALAGKDIVAGAVTGSGKTAAFLIPILERLAHRPRGGSEAKTRVVVLTPTRELAVQCFNVGKALARYTDVRFCLCVGGLSSKSQEQELKTRPEIVIATPGRLIDHIRNSASFGIDDVEILVMDEADRMLEEGFAAELNEIIQATPKGRQTMLFSATMTDDVDELVRLSLRRPVRLFVDPKRSTATKLVQEFVRVRGATGGEAEGSSSAVSRRTEDEARPALLISLCLRTFRHQVIIFVRSKKLAHQLKILFGLVGLAAAELHGDLSQEQRLGSLQSFKEGKVDFLLATDLASRGLDIKGVQTVINYDMPAQLEVYIHRVGRTARAGKEGRAVTLVGEADRRLLKAVLKKSPASQVRHRLVPADIVGQVRDQLAELRSDVEAVLAEEKEEKALQLAERELKRGENLVEHRDEIMSRPKRTWFQTQQEKEEASRLSLRDYAPQRKDAQGKDRFAGLSRRKKRTKMAREEGAEDASAGRAMAAQIRAAKREEKPKELGVVERKKGKKEGKKGKKTKSSAQAAGGAKAGAVGGGAKKSGGAKKGKSAFSKDFGERGGGGGGGGKKGRK